VLLVPINETLGSQEEWTRRQNRAATESEWKKVVFVKSLSLKHRTPRFLRGSVQWHQGPKTGRDVEMSHHAQLRSFPMAKWREGVHDSTQTGHTWKRGKRGSLVVSPKFVERVLVLDHPLSALKILVFVCKAAIDAAVFGIGTCQPNQAWNIAASRNPRCKHYSRSTRTRTAGD
jgi:hypothetical protein